jgi:hypothetical protein
VLPAQALGEFGAASRMRIGDHDVEAIDGELLGDRRSDARPGRRRDDCNPALVFSACHRVVSKS